MNSNIKSPENECRVCGYSYQSPTWFDDETPSNDICVCCGVQFGYEDTTRDGVSEYRNEWIAKGAIWFSKHHKQKLKDWNLEAQLSQVPDKWK